MSKEIILVDQDNNIESYDDKINSHFSKKLHRAFSVFIYNGKDILIQKRAKNKYHSSNLWSNACCGHPRPYEKIIDGAERRTEEELGFQVKLSYKLNILYRLKLDNGLSEYELTSIFFNKKDINSQNIKFNKKEISKIRWISIENLINEIKKNNHCYSAWMNLYITKYFNEIFNLKKY